MKNVLYTIGHSQHELEYFVKMLNEYDINYLLDVRSIPYSQFAANYNREHIKAVLNNVGIKYIYMGSYFGARPDDEDLFTKEGYLDFEKARKCDRFKAGVENVIKGIREGNSISLMCTEKDPIECHRAIMVARTFYELEVEVQHILGDGSLQSHDVLEQRLLELYFSNRHQITLFQDSKTDDECLREAYRCHNAKIGYYKDNSVE